MVIIMQNSWVYEPVVPYYEMMLFQNAISQNRDAFCYFPVAMAKRCEVGMKYRYLCIVRQNTFPAKPTSFVIIEIYKSELGIPYITRRLRVTAEDY